MAYRSSPFERSPLSTVAGIIIGLVVLYVLFNIVGWIIGLLYRFAPLLLIAALIIDYKVVLSYVRGIGNLFQRNWIYGLVAGLATLAFYPFVFLYFLGAALFKRRVKQAREEADIQRNGKFIDYEEVATSAPGETLDTDYEELPPPPEPLPREERKDSDYDAYFK